MYRNDLSAAINRAETAEGELKRMKEPKVKPLPTPVPSLRKVKMNDDTNDFLFDVFGILVVLAFVVFWVYSIKANINENDKLEKNKKQAREIRNKNASLICQRTKNNVAFIIEREADELFRLKCLDRRDNVEAILITQYELDHPKPAPWPWKE